MVENAWERARNAIHTYLRRDGIEWKATKNWRGFSVSSNS
jgi:hypothetical protein